MSFARSKNLFCAPTQYECFFTNVKQKYEFRHVEEYLEKAEKRTSDEEYLEKAEKRTSDEEYLEKAEKRTSDEAS